MTKLKLSGCSLKGKRVLLRVDFNVPLHEDGSISDDTRIRASLPTIRWILDHGGSCILMSHLGRPQGKKDPKATLAMAAKRLSSLLGQEVLFALDCIGPAVEPLAGRLHPGQVLLLENLRFHPGEENPEKEPGFVEALAKLGDLYVNDAFGTAHRAHASTALIARYFPGKAAMGLLIEQELKHLSPLLQGPVKPFYMVVGGSKVSTKAGVLKHLLSKIDALFLGGGMSFAFFKAKGIGIGNSLCNGSDVPIAADILQAAGQRSLPLHLPRDHLCAKEGEAPRVFAEVPEGWAGMDIGPKTVEEWSSSLQRASTVFWNGPLGVFERPPFDRGTKAIAESLARSQGSVIVGGGDSVAAVEQMGLSDRFAHLSTGGGACLEFLEFGHLPGIDALSEDKI